MWFLHKPHTHTFTLIPSFFSLWSLRKIIWMNIHYFSTAPRITFILFVRLHSFWSYMYNVTALLSELERSSICTLYLIKGIAYRCLPCKKVPLSFIWTATQINDNRMQRWYNFYQYNLYTIWNHTQRLSSYVNLIYCLLPGYYHIYELFCTWR